jgi:two-component system NtrC family sensor kinase
MKKSRKRPVREWRERSGGACEPQRTWSACGGSLALLRADLTQHRHLTQCSKLVSGLVHEINNPLDGVINSLRMVRSGKLSAERQTEYLTLAEQELFRVAALTRRLLGLSREQPLVLVPADLNELVSKALFFVDYRMSLNGVRLDKSLARRLPKVLVDQTSVMQVLANLLLNAVESMPAGGTLSVATASDAAGVAVTVGDSGCGISEEHLGRVFHPFFSTKKGTGLGLAIALNIVEQHGGTISVESAVGKGSIFTVRFPRR